uniref:ethanolamine-phosphate cytidylyltransferase n=1 Tax=Oryza rufipogon TaxID=4529 RepID=A0A0E0RD19_ORYRU
MWAPLIDSSVPRGSESPHLSSLSRSSERQEREPEAASPLPHLPDLLASRPPLEWRYLLHPRAPIPNPRSLLPRSLAHDQSPSSFLSLSLSHCSISQFIMEAGAGSSSAKLVAACVIGGIVLGASVVALHLAGPVAIPALPPVDALRRRFRRGRRRPVRVYMDGCFDMMHYGHCNALRQAHALGDELIVGVVSDDEITANKGPPVTPLHERLIMVRAVKWVHDVIPDAPYAITEDFMNKLFNEYNIDYIIHGDDPCLLPDGTDAYALAKKVGRYKQIKRTEGVSTTDIVGRMLLCVRERSASDSHNHSSLQRQFSHGHGQKIDDSGSGSGTRISHFLPTSRRIVHSTRGPHRPIMNLHERSLSVLACRYVDEVIIGAPWDVSKDMITTFNISLVVHGTIAENMDFMKDDLNPYAVPRAMGIYRRLESPLDITTSTIIRRIVANHEAYQVCNMVYWCYVKLAGGVWFFCLVHAACSKVHNPSQINAICLLSTSY